MGLDMYAFAFHPDKIDNAPVDVTKLDDEYEPLQFDYWRKFNHLHGWMRDLYYQKGGTGEFNCNTVRLDLEDLEKLEKASNARALVPTEGFFFGSYDDFNDEDAEVVWSFVQKAKELIREGYVVYYDSWW